MDKNKILEKLLEIMLDVFDNNTLNISMETRAEDIEEWDSMSQINLLVAIEEEYKFKFIIEEVLSLQTVNDIVELISEKVSC